MTATGALRPNILWICTDQQRFDMVFDIHTEAISTDEDLQALVAMASSEVGVRAKVIEAHRVLMGLSDGNRAKFQELVTTLENAGP